MLPALVLMEQARSADDPAGEQRPAEIAAVAPPWRQLGDYRILREVGRGGMGVVYEAQQLSLGRRVALKVLPKQMLLDAQAKRRFEREARSAAKLHHTNIVPVFGVGEHDGLPYYVMQFIQGLGLDRVLDELKHVPSPETLAAVARWRRAGSFAQERRGAPNSPIVDDGRLSANGRRRASRG